MRILTLSELVDTPPNNAILSKALFQNGYFLGLSSLETMASEGYRCA
jgi:hypothetical protein